jgi:hypothetical protein
MTTANLASAVLSGGDVVYATGHAACAGNQTTLLLT